MNASASFLEVDRINEELYSTLGAWVSKVVPDEISVSLCLISRCGAGVFEVDATEAFDASWQEDVVKQMLGTATLREWLEDASFGSFKKSDLYLAMYRDHSAHAPCYRFFLSILRLLSSGRWFSLRA